MNANVGHSSGQEEAEAQEQFEKRRRGILLELRAFFEEWSAVARVEFKGRRDLIPSRPGSA